jgi:rare lipoprotein A
MKYTGKIAVASCALMLASCGGSDKMDAKSAGAVPPASENASGVSDYPVKIGAPFTVGGKSYKPEDVANYDEVGYASWYGDELAGNPTANGEVFMASGISGAHKTLPMPSYVEVTALETGRTILVRINDRGPFANDRLIDLSAGAARELGIMGQGVAGVRVRKVNPPEHERAILRTGQSASTRIATPESLLKILRDKLGQMPKPSGPAPQVSVPRPTEKVRPAVTVPPPVRQDEGRFVRENAGSASSQPATTRPVPPTKLDQGFVVQVAAYSSRARAEDAARRLGAMVYPSADGRVFRVRFGPYATQAEAENARVKATAKGYPQARVFEE